MLQKTQIVAEGHAQPVKNDFNRPLRKDTSSTHALLSERNSHTHAHLLAQHTHFLGKSISHAHGQRVPVRDVAQEERTSPTHPRHLLGTP